MWLSFIKLLHFQRVFLHLNKPIQNGGSDMIASFLVIHFKETWIINFEPEILNCLSERTQLQLTIIVSVDLPSFKKFQQIVLKIKLIL